MARELSVTQAATVSMAHLAQVQHIGAHCGQGIDCLQYCHSLDALKTITRCDCAHNHPRNTEKVCQEDPTCDPSNIPDDL